MEGAPDDERGELRAITRYAARRVKEYEQLMEEHQQEVRARERSYREREYRALELPLPPKPWTMPGAYGAQAGRMEPIPSARKEPAEASVATPGMPRSEAAFS
jgi:hypothetical protein